MSTSGSIYNQRQGHYCIDMRRAEDLVESTYLSHHYPPLQTDPSEADKITLPNFENIEFASDEVYQSRVEFKPEYDKLRQLSENDTNISQNDRLLSDYVKRDLSAASECFRQRSATDLAVESDDPILATLPQSADPIVVAALHQAYNERVNLNRQMGSLEDQLAEAPETSTGPGEVEQGLRFEISNVKEEVQQLQSERDVAIDEAKERRQERDLAQAELRGLNEALKIANREDRPTAQEWTDTKAKLDLTTNDLTLIRTELSELKATEVSMKNELQETRTAKETTGKRADSLEKELEETKGANIAAAKRAGSLEKELEETRIAKDAVASRAESLEKELKETKVAKETTGKRADSLEKELEETKGANTTAAKRADSLEKELEETRIAKDTVASRAESLEKELKETRVAKDSFAERADSLKNELVETKAAKDSADEREKATQEQLSNAETAKGNANRRVEELEKGLEESQSAGTKANQMVLELQKQLQESQSSIAGAEGKAASLETQLKESQFTIAEAKGKVSSLETQNKESQSTIAEAKGKVSSLETQNKESQSTIAEAKGKVSSLETQNEESQSTIAQANEKVSELQEQLQQSRFATSEAKGEVSELQKQLKKSQEATSEAKGEVSELQKQLKKSQEATSEAKGEVSGLQKQLKKSQEATSEAQKQVQESHNITSNLQGDLDQTKKDKESAKSEAEEKTLGLRKELEDSKSTNHDLQENLDQAKSNEQATTARANGLAEKNKSANDQLNDARHAFSRVRDSQRALIKSVNHGASTITFLLMILGQKAKQLETRNSILSNRITALESEKERLHAKHSDDIHSISERLNAVSADSQWVRVQVKKWRATYQFKRELPSVPFLTPEELSVSSGPIEQFRALLHMLVQDIDANIKLQTRETNKKVADTRKAAREGLQKKIQSLKQELSNSTEQQSALKRDNESKDQKLVELNNEITTKDEQLKALKDEKQNATSSMESLEKTIKYKNKRVVELTEELQQKNNELEETKSDMESFEEDLNSISKTYEKAPSNFWDRWQGNKPTHAQVVGRLFYDNMELGSREKNIKTSIDKVFKECQAVIPSFFKNEDTHASLSQVFGRVAEAYTSHVETFRQQLEAIWGFTDVGTASFEELVKRVADTKIGYDQSFNELATVLDVDAPSTHVPIEAPFVQQIEKLKQRDHDLNDVQLQVLSLPSAVGLGDRKRLVNGSTTTILSDMGSEMTVTMRNIVLNCGKGVTHVETWSQVASELKGAFKELEESLASLRQEKAEVISDLTSVVELLDTKLQELQASQDEIQSLYKNGKEHRQWFLTEQHTRKGYKDIIDRLLPHAGINVEEFWMNTGRQRSENEDGEEHVEH